MGRFYTLRWSESQSKRKAKADMADERAFRRAVAAVRAAGADGRVAVSDAHKLTLYGLFKQATDGDCRKAQPSALRVDCFTVCWCSRWL
jgi:hypothetical protein